MSGKSKGWAAPPPVMVVSGTQEFLRNREIQKATRAALASGRRVVHVGVGDGQMLSDLLSSAFIFSSETLAIVESAPVRKKSAKKKAEAEPSGEDVEGGWTEEDLELVLEHSKSSFSEISLVIHHDGEPQVLRWTSGRGPSEEPAAGLPRPQALGAERARPEVLHG